MGGILVDYELKLLFISPVNGAYIYETSRQRARRVKKEIEIEKQMSPRRKKTKNANFSNALSAEYRAIIEKSIGRKLNSYEHIHHIDRDRHNNTPINLALLYSKLHNHYHLMELKYKDSNFIFYTPFG